MSLMRGVKRLSEQVVTHGKGSYVWTTEGKKLLDFTAGIGVLSTGHCHPTITEAVVKQAALGVHLQQSCYRNDVAQQLVEKLKDVTPPSMDSFFLTTTGAEAVESAVRLARQATGRNNVIVFQGGYHGRTVGTLALTTSSIGYRGNMAGPLPGNIAVAPYPFYEQLFGVPAPEDPDAGENGRLGLTSHVMRQMDLVLQQQSPAHETACVLIEPVLGEGGYVAPPPAFLPALRAWCDKHGILLIADEVQSGFGRTGEMFAVDHWNVDPDILVIAKGIASGYPLAAVASRSELTDKQLPGSMGGTYGGNAVGCAAALATLRVFEEEGIVENARARGNQLQQALRGMQAEGLPIREVRGLGLMSSMSLERQTAGAGAAGRLSAACQEQGLLLLTTAAPEFESIRFIPPLTVSEGEMDEALTIIKSSLSSL